MLHFFVHVQVYTIMAFIMAIPVAFYMEYDVVSKNLDSVVSQLKFETPSFSGMLKSTQETKLFEMHLITGLFFYM
jgi:hypothetical protein